MIPFYLAMSALAMSILATLLFAVRCLPPRARPWVVPREQPERTCGHDEASLSRRQRRLTMGTRADFYVGLGPTAEWLGSIAFDGDEIDETIEGAATEADYCNAVEAFLASRDDATTPNQGWPWLWNNSQTTDYSYAFVNGACETFQWGRPAEADESAPKLDWPDMTARKNVTFGKRSGTIVFGG